MKHIPFVLIMLVISSCSANKKTTNTNTSKQNTEAYKKIATERFGNNVVFELSPNKSYMLCAKKYSDNDTNPNRLCDFFVMNLKTQKIEYEDKIHSCKISWHTDHKLKLVKHRGIAVSPMDDGKDIYIYNLKTHKKEKVDAIEFKR